MTVKPLTPDEIANEKTGIFPDSVIEAFNETIARHYLNGRSSFTIKEVLELMISKGLKEADVFENHWLDVEPIYEANGWKVECDVPAHDESYAARFIFLKKHGRSNDPSLMVPPRE